MCRTPIDDQPRYHVISCRIDEETARRVEKLTTKRILRSDVARTALLQYLEREGIK